ncbi:MAG: hypothetical protein HYX74_11195 [Acidobacteria bacterium]|nr:hypothetical protein [Acidobacteriota bacterium]
MKRARISHKTSAAAADPGLFTALRSVGILDVLFKYACGALGRAPCHHARLHRFTTLPCEKGGLASRLKLLWLAVALALVMAPPALAQCSMCRTSLSVTGDRGMRALNVGVLMLLVPTVAMMAGIGIVIYRRRD